jgi:hypothetical protein
MRAIYVATLASRNVVDVKHTDLGGFPQCGNPRFAGFKLPHHDQNQSRWFKWQSASDFFHVLFCSIIRQ